MRAWIGICLFTVALMSEAASAQGSAKKPLDVSYVTDDFFAAVVIHPARLLKAPALKGLPVEKGLANLKEAIGVDLKQVEQVIVLLSDADISRLIDDVTWLSQEKRRVEVENNLRALGRAIGEFQSPPASLFPRDLKEKPPRSKESHPRLRRDGVAAVGVIVRFNQFVAGRELLLRAAKPLGVRELEELVHGKRRGTYFRPKGRIPLGAHVPDEKTIVLAEEETLRRMMEADKVDSPLVRRLRELSAEDDFTAVVVTDPLRQSVAKIKQELQRHRLHGEEAFLITLMQELLKHVDSYSAAGNMHEPLSARYEIHSPNEESAEMVHDLFRGYVAVLKIIAPAMEEQLARGAKQTGGAERAVLRRMMGVLKEMADSVEIKRDGRRVMMSLELGDEYPKLLAAMISLAGEIRLKAQEEQQAINNLRALALAVHNHADVNRGRLPAQGSYDKNGKPLLSWRVHLLPYLEQQHLYRQFRLDEPWDSPHNKKLIARMPSIFKSPGHDLPEGKTSFVLPVADEREKYRTMVPQGPLKGQANLNGLGRTTFGSITDGLSNAILFVEAAPKSAVIWTQPDDWEFKPAKPRAGLFGMRKGRVLAAIGDGSVRRISEKVSDATLRRAMGRSDGEPYEEEEFRGEVRPRPKAESKKKIGFSVLSLENPFFKIMADNLTAEAKNHGYEVIVHDAQRDVGTQSGHIDSFIAQKVSAIVLTPADRIAIGPAVKRANAAGVPVFTCDLQCRAKGAKIAGHVGVDNYQGGRLAGKAMIEALGEAGGEVLVLHFPQADSCALRVKGFKEVIEKHNQQDGRGKIKIVKVLDGGGLRAAGFRATSDALAAHPNLAGIFAINDPSALGAWQALRQAGKQDQVNIVAFDGQREGRQAIKDGKIYADPVQFPDKLGRVTMQNIVRHLRGDPYPRVQLIPLALYRKADAEKDPELK